MYSTQSLRKHRINRLHILVVEMSGTRRLKPARYEGPETAGPATDPCGSGCGTRLSGTHTSPLMMRRAVRATVALST